MFKLKMKANPMTLMAFVLVLAAMYMVLLNKPEPRAPVKTVRFAPVKNVHERPAPAHMQADPNSRMW